MADQHPLTSEIIRRQPRTAATILAAQAPAEAGLFLTRLPADPLARLLPFVSAWQAAAYMRALAPQQAIVILTALSWRQAVAALRAMPRTASEALLAALTGVAAERFADALKYREDQVGAWIERQIVELPEGATIGEAREIAAAHRSAALLYMTTEDDRLLGIVPGWRLLDPDPQTPVADVALTAIHPLSHTATVAHALNAPGWDELPSLPVVDDEGLLIGELTFGALRTAQRRLARPDNGLEASTMLGEVSMAYLSVVGGLLQWLQTDEQL